MSILNNTDVSEIDSTRENAKQGFVSFAGLRTCQTLQEKHCRIRMTFHVGDVQKDFWLAFDLLRSPKDHAEFTIVRDWVRDALRVFS